MRHKTGLSGGSQAPIAFAHFLRSLEADNFSRSAATLLFAFFLLGAWTAWLILARVTLYEVSDAARLEADQAGYTLEASVPGRVVSANLTVGKEVKAGDVLAQLDTSEQRLQLDEERTRLASITPQIQALASQIAAEERAITEAREAGGVALEEARARVEEAESAAQYAAEQARRLSALFGEGVISEMEVLRARAEAKSRSAGVDSLRLTVNRMEREQHTRETERRAGIERLLRERSLLEGQRSTSAAVVERLQNEIEKRVIRSPATGLLGEVANSKPGAMLREGDKLGTIVPAGEIRVVAEFSPSALGRVRPGQLARVRMASFPWTQYGSLTATVKSVAGEVRDGKIRVELAVLNAPTSPIPIQHGLPGTVEIEVERVSPATLLLRTVKFLAAPSERDARATD
ncbi:MAG TPA: HlyD family efflux transporter periplasmic adaptor subunit [Pyrinomonadaceae bacterium]|jgi:membrane fusion protein (multidrug efflux system)